MDNAHFHQIYDDGREYDQLYGIVPKEEVVDFYHELARRTAAPVLELACGTGRVLIPLARRGCEVVGVDLSEGMLAEARRKSADLAAEWVQGDMRDFSLGRTFGLIYIPNNTLCHLLDRAAFAACMARVKEHLNPDGRFVVEVFPPAPQLLLDKPGERFPFGEFEDPNGRKTVVTHSYVYELDTQIKRITTYTRTGDGDEVAGSLDMRMYYPQELDLLLEHHGFSIEHKYGGYDRTPYDAQSATQLVVCSVQ